MEEWMLICQCNADLQPNTHPQEDFDWTQGAQAYPNLEEMPTFITWQRESAAEHTFTTFADPPAPAEEAAASLHSWAGAC